MIDYAGISQRTTAYAEVVMLRNTEPVIILGKLGQSKPVPKNKSETVKFRRARILPPALVPLAEGVTPTPGSFGYDDVQVTLKQWGDLLVITDKVADLCEDPVLNDMSRESGKQAGATVEQVTYGVVKAGTSVFYANGVSRAAVNTAISLNKQRAVTRFLHRNKAKKFTEILSGSVQLGTMPIEAAYIAVGHTDLDADIRNMPGFVPVAKYGSRKTVSEHEIGSVEEVRYILSPDLLPIEDAGGAPGSSVLSTGGAQANVYPVLFFGMDAFGTCPLKGKGAISPTVINPGQKDKSDPLGQRGYVGWSAWYNAVRLNELWMARLEVAATAL